MHAVSLFEAKTHLSRIVEDLLTGKEDQVVISRRGKPVALVTPLGRREVSKRIGLARKRFKIPDNIDGANAAIAALFAGEGGAAMRLLLDTQIALWALLDSPRLSSAARELILDPDTDIYFSAATVWEIANKHRLAGKDMPVSGSEAAKLFVEAGYMELPVLARHAAATETLPMHHSDPFDRILVAQAMSEPLHLLTHDRALLQYGDCVMFV